MSSALFLVRWFARIHCFDVGNDASLVELAVPVQVHVADRPALRIGSFSPTCLNEEQDGENADRGQVRVDPCLVLHLTQRRQTDLPAFGRIAKAGRDEIG